MLKTLDLAWRCLVTVFFRLSTDGRGHLVEAVDWLADRLREGPRPAQPENGCSPPISVAGRGVFEAPAGRVVRAQRASAVNTTFLGLGPVVPRTSVPIPRRRLETAATEPYWLR